MDSLDVKQLTSAVRAIADDKNLSEEEVVKALETAIAAAWRRDNGDKDMTVTSSLDNDGNAKIFVHYLVVDDPENSSQISLKDAKEIDPNAELDKEVVKEYKATTFGRIATQTAKQVLIQKLREFEKESIAKLFNDKVGQILTGTVIRIEPKVTRVELGKGEGIIPLSEQIPGERLQVGNRVKVLLKNIDRDGVRGPAIILSRADSNFIKQLFFQEVPELENGSVEIKGIAREAGRRTKIAVYSANQDVDPVGTFVGTKGIRVQVVMSEISEAEKIDVITYDEDIKNYIANALSPAEINRIDVDESNKKATVFVPLSQQSIAIGRQGQNVRLASELTGYELDIIPEEDSELEQED